MFSAAKHSGWRREAGYPEASREPGGGRLKNTDLTVTAPDMPPLPPYVKVAENGTPVRQVEERGQGTISSFSLPSKHQPEGRLKSGGKDSTDERKTRYLVHPIPHGDRMRALKNFGNEVAGSLMACSKQEGEEQVGREGRRRWGGISCSQD